jgi:sugar transferase EpsL
MFHDALKRAVDLGVVIVMSVPLLAVALVVAGVVRVKLGTPVLFCQVRPGLYGTPFLLLKFRTMTDERDSAGNLLPDDVRLTSTGRLLRALSLDELPQLINVLRGEMSLVGPRPLLMQYLDRYTPTQARRMDVRPGITGWAQVNGRNAVSWEERFEMDVWYVEHRSLWLDLRILLLTLLKVVRREGVSAAGHATMPEFRGSTTTSSNSMETR